MAWSMTNTPQRRTLNTLSGTGAIACVLGVIFLTAPLFLGNSPVVKPVAPVMLAAGWPALGLGLLLLGIRFALKSKAEETIELSPLVPIKHQRTTLQEAFADMPPPAPGDDDADAFCALTTQPPPAPPSTWSPAVFAAIEWRRFEAVCEALFAQAGFETRPQSRGDGGGVDIWLHSANAQGPVAVVQCKHGLDQSVGVEEIREFFAVMASHQVKRGTYATTSSFTADAQLFAKDNGINPMDGPALLALIARRTPRQQQALLAVAFEGEY